MGTTRDALEAGPVRFGYTVAIEGYDKLLVHGDPGAGLLAWTNGWTITKTSPNAHDGGAFSVEAITGDGYVETTVTNVTMTKAIGLSATDASAHWTTIQFGLLMDATQLTVRESGGLRYTGTIAVDDVLRIERVGSTIRYYQNGALLYTSLVSSTGALHVDASIFNNGATIRHINLVDRGRPVQLSWTLTNCTAAVTSGTDWQRALGGLFVDWTSEQSLDPDNPFGGMGQCHLWVVQDGTDDTFGTEVNRRRSGAETYLTASLDRDDTTATVKATGAFGGLNEIHIGTECIGFSGSTSTTFTGLVRGKYSPFGTWSDVDAGTVRRFARDHRVSLDAQSVLLQPVVSQYPRMWKGRLVGVWMHRIVNGVWDAKDQAELVYAGVIGEIRDDAGTGATVIEVRSILDHIGDRVLGASMWEGQIEPGIYISADGPGFDFIDSDGSTSRAANELTVVSSGATGPNQINEGTYTLGDLCSKLTAWLQAEKAANRLHGNYTIEAPSNSYPRTRIFTSPIDTTWKFYMPTQVAFGLGFRTYLTPQGDGSAMQLESTAVSWEVASGISTRLTGSPWDRVAVSTTSGEFEDQYGELPAAMKPATAGGKEWGLFVIGDSLTVVAAKEGDTLTHMRAWQWEGEGEPMLTVSPDEPAPRVRQIFAFEGTLIHALAAMLTSTGTSQYNVPVLDVMPRALSIGIPYELTMALDTVGQWPLDGQIAFFLEKPTKFRDLFESDLVIRRVFLRWRDGVVQFGSWRSPVSTLASYVLDEEAKAEPAGNTASHVVATTEHTEWLKSVVKIEFGRSIAKPGDAGDFEHTYIFEDRVAVDDQGGAAEVHTISLTNTYSEFDGTGASAEALLASYMASMPLFSRPAHVVERSIDPRYFWRLGVGDVVLFSDSFARDPQTGERGISARPAIVVRHFFRVGGKTRPGSDTEPMGGRVRLFFTDVDTERSGMAYVPCADVSSYNSTTKVLTCYEHRYSESSEPADAARFVVGDKVRIIERDPLDPDVPLSWDDVVAAQAGNTITLTTGLTSPTFDTDKVYRVIYDDWSDAISAQQFKVFQADETDGLVSDDAQPFLYVIGTGDTVYTANSATPDIELVPASSYADGSGRDVGHEAALVRAVDNFIDYKSAIHGAHLFPSEVSSSGVGANDWLLVDVRPVYLTPEILTNGVRRYVSIAPMARSTDGTATRIRITLATNPPRGGSLTNVNRGSRTVEAVWENITSTTAAILTPQLVSATVKEFGGRYVWMLVEVGNKCATWGVARLVEGARQYL